MRTAMIGVIVAALLPLAACGGGEPREEPLKTGKCDIVARYDLPAQRFDETAQALAHASGCFVHTRTDQTAAVPANAVHGRMTIRQALQTAIDGTPLNITENRPDSVTIE